MWAIHAFIMTSFLTIRYSGSLWSTYMTLVMTKHQTSLLFEVYSASPLPSFAGFFPPYNNSVHSTIYLWTNFPYILHIISLQVQIKIMSVFVTHSKLVFQLSFSSRVILRYFGLLLNSQFLPQEERAFCSRSYFFFS